MKYIRLGGREEIALLDSRERIIPDTQAVLDVILSAKYETGCEKLILHKECFAEAFFILSTGMAGEILQKFVNYHMSVAIVGDYSGYTSKPLRDFIYESNRGNAVFFVPSVEDAVEKLSNGKESA